MSIEREHIQELGEAIEQLGVIVEGNLARINQKLENLDQVMGGQDKGIKQELCEIKEETSEIREFLENYDARLSRIEIRISELLKEKEGTPSEFEKLSDIRSILASLREDANEILGRGEYIDKKIREFEGRIEDLEKDKT